MLETYRETCESIFEENFEYLDLLLKTFKIDGDELKDLAGKIKETIIDDVLQIHSNHQNEYEAKKLL